MKNPYDLNLYKPKIVKVNNKKKAKDRNQDIALHNYHFDIEISGVNKNRQLLLTAGYLGAQENADNAFLLDDNDIDNLVEELLKAKEAIEKGKEVSAELEDIHERLNSDIQNGFVDHIEMEYKPTLLPPHFNQALYKPFKITPIYINNINKENISFKDGSFLEVLYLSIVEEEFDKTMDYMRGYHDIDIHIYGWDYNEELEKRKKEALKDLDKDIKRRKDKKRMKAEEEKYTKMLNEITGGAPSMMNMKPGKGRSSVVGAKK